MSTVAFYTLGCKLNFAESSAIGQQLSKAGFEKREFQEGADLYVINTCSVTDHADRKCKKVVREALKQNPQAYVVVIGCYAQLKPQEIAQIPGVDMVLGAAEKFQLIDHLHTLVKEPKTLVHNAPIKEVNTFVPGYSVGDRTRIFLKVQDGCDYFCSFCTIPLARGKSRSANVVDTLKLVEEAAQQGAKEIVLTGVNLGDFGVEHEQSFFDLVKAIDEVEGVDRYRISSIEPNLLTDEIIEFVSQSKRFVPHLIVGFPGETEEHFLETYRFLNELDVSYLHVFPYSERANTTAKKMKDVVPVKVRMERGEMLRGLSEKKRMAFYREHLGTSRPVLFEEEERRGVMFGFTDNYIKVATDYDPLLVNTVVDVQLASLNPEGWVQAEFDYATVGH
ncbi:MAG: tRNA ((6)-L-threonylcarbamoyladenosine(37)-C(2))-methylthiotransferase MtaB [Bacteroidota bacterium]